VFLPECGEDLDVLASTFAHVAALTWRGTVRVYVLDDGHSPDFPALARARQFIYIACTNRGEFKKAGNLNYALDNSGGAVPVLQVVP
jgi:cellulose synthase (UDP-forming)